MKRLPLSAITLFGMFALGGSHSSALGDSAALSTQPAAPTKSAPIVPQSFQPGMDDLMTMLVLPRHIKLYYAGAAQNWELAAFELGELRSAFRRISSTISVYRDRDVEETIGALLTPRLDATQSAIEAGDTARFVKSYEALTASCNACHSYLEHPFLVIKVPPARAASAYPNQSFERLPP